MLILGRVKGFEFSYSSITFAYLSCILSFDVANMSHNLGVSSNCTRPRIALIHTLWLTEFSREVMLTNQTHRTLEGCNLFHFTQVLQMFVRLQEDMK